MIVNYFYMIIVMIKDWLSVSKYREFISGKVIVKTKEKGIEGGMGK